MKNDAERPSAENAAAELSRLRRALVDRLTASTMRAAALRTSLALVVLIFAIDLYMPAVVAFGILYVLPVLVSVWGSRRKLTFGIAAVCTVLTPVGALMSLTGPSFPDTIATLAQGLEPLLGDDAAHQVVMWEFLQVFCAVFVIWVTAGLGLMRIETERELLQTRELTAIALQSSADGVLTTDTGDRVSFLNAVAEELTGWDLEAARGRRLAEVFPLETDPETRPNGELELLEEMLPLGGGGAARRRLLRTRDGARHPVEASAAPIYDRERRCKGRVIVFRDASDLAAYETRLRELAFRDRLTGLPNRTSLSERLDLELAHARRDGGQLAVLFLDLDHFKVINDTLGHHAGDELLRAVAQRLIGCLREADTVARLGGDEFVVLVPGLGSPDDAAAVANKILAALAKPILLEGELHPILPSIGIALFPSDGDTADVLLRSADRAMYRAKGSGGARYALFGGQARGPAGREVVGERSRDVAPVTRDE